MATDTTQARQTSDEAFMRRCIQLARKGILHAAPNPTVGAVIVRDGRIIGEGWHRRCGQAHAEVNAVGAVADKALLRGATIYVSLEPCSHWGKTPPCARLLVECGFARVVVGCVDPFAKVHGAGIAILREAGIKVDVGICEDECRALIRRFATFQEMRRPYVILKWAQSSDGCIDALRTADEAARGIRPVVLSTPVTRMLVHKLRAECQAIAVGTRTALLDDPTLTVRHWAGPNPLRVVIDREGRLPRSLHVMDGTVPTVICTDNPRGLDIPGLEEMQMHRTDDGSAATGEGTLPQAILTELHRRGIQTLLVEGGARTLQSFIDAGLWDEARIETNPAITIGDGVAAPRLAGARLASAATVDGNLIETWERCPHD